MGDRLDQIENPSWFLQPADGIVAGMVALLKMEPVFAKIFGEEIDGYKRMDYGARAFPAMRIYSDTGRNEGVTWYAQGDVKVDVILPASVRRDDLQVFADRVTSVLFAQIRRQPFLDSMRKLVPGLNELGKLFSWDKGLAFQPAESEDLFPMVQLVVHYRVLMEEWDRFLESDERTVDQPFERTLDDLLTFYMTLIAQDDAGNDTQAGGSFNVKPGT